MKPVQELAGLLCYTDPVAQTKGKDLGQFLTAETRKCLIDAIVVAISSASDMQGKAGSSGTMKLSQMIKQIKVTQDMLIESR